MPMFPMLVLLLRWANRGRRLRWGSANTPTLACKQRVVHGRYVLVAFETILWHPGILFTEVRRRGFFSEVGRYAMRGGLSAGIILLVGEA